MLRLSTFSVALLALSASATALQLACGDSSATGGLTPITGILIRSDNLVAGKGCGVGAMQVYRYAATVTDSDGRIVAAGIYDCFADGVFTNLSPSSGGSLDFTVRIYAYDRATYEAGKASIEQSLVSDQALATTRPTWVTTCRATQQQDIQVLAVCAPLGPVASSSITVETTTFPLGDGGVASCRAAYEHVSATLSGLDAGAVRCPDPLVLRNVSAPATVEVQAALEADGGLFGRTRCRAETVPGQSVNAVCEPLLR